MPANAVTTAEALARDFLERVWGPAHDLDAVDELMTEDYVIHSNGKVIRGRSAFKAWIAEFFRNMPGASDEILEIFANPAGDRVTARWICSGTNRGVFGLPADERQIAFHGISVWMVKDGRLAECWVEREAARYLE
jgi:steroid delta-isomerase-like uncharacterized protein